MGFKITKYVGIRTEQESWSGPSELDRKEFNTIKERDDFTTSVNARNTTTARVPDYYITASRGPDKVYDSDEVLVIVDSVIELAKKETKEGRLEESQLHEFRQSLAKYAIGAEDSFKPAKKPHYAKALRR